MKTLAEVKNKWSNSYFKSNFLGHHISRVMPTSLSPLEIRVDEVKYKILGTGHLRYAGPEYLNLISTNIRKSDNWLCEQDISKVFKEAQGCLFS